MTHPRHLKVAEIATSLLTQLFLLIIAFGVFTPRVWTISFGLVALISLWASLLAFRRWRMVRDTPVSRIGDAIQGYRQISGQAKPMPGQQAIYSVSGQAPCVWQRYQRRNISAGKRGLDFSVETDTPFMLDDGSGECVIDPSDAEVRSTRKAAWREGDLWYKEWTLRSGETLDAIGEFRAYGGSSLDADLHDDISNILSQWKRDMPKLLRYFDHDGDGVLNEQEWQAVRQAAEHKAQRRLAALRAQPPQYRLIKPQDGRPFLISNQPRRHLEASYLAWGLVQLGMLLAALIAVAWMIQHGEW
jgi:hypothetical protein